jgi:hypothetical protein
VAVTTLSWTSHVGIIVDYKDGDWIVAESGMPFVRKTPLRKFLGRSVDQKFSIRRLKTPPTADAAARDARSSPTPRWGSSIRSDST